MGNFVNPSVLVKLAAHTVGTIFRHFEGIFDLYLQFTSARTQRIGQFDLHACVGNQIIGLFSFAVFDDVNVLDYIAVGECFVVKTTAFNGAGGFAARIFAVNVLVELQPQKVESVGTVIGVGDQVGAANSLC